MQGGIHDDGSIAGAPWASVFDPEINAKAFGAIQARGFRAATEVVDRLLKSAERGAEKFAEPTSDAAAGSGGGADTSTAPVDVERLVTTWQTMVGQLARSVRDTVAAPEPATATFDLFHAKATGRLDLETPQPGTASTEVWLHNQGAVDLGKVRLRCSDLLAHDGATVPCAAVRFEPDTVPMPARSSRGVTLEIDIADGVAPGQYHGTLLADGHPDVWLPVTLIVRPVQA